MTTRAVSWGLLISASLPVLSACSAASPEVVAPTRPADSAPLPGAGPVLGFGPFVPLSPEGAPITSSTRTFPGFHQERVFFGHGSLLVRSLKGWEHSPDGCPILGAKEGCATFTLELTEQGSADELWRTGEAPSSAVTRTVASAIPAHWTAVFGGREAPYVFTPGGESTVYQLNDQGEPQPVFQNDLADRWAQLRVIELGEGRVVVGHRESAALQVAEVLSDGPEKARKLGPMVELGMTPVPRQLKTVREIRDIEYTHKLPLYGPLVAVPTKDNKGSQGAEWALVWVELAPGVRSWPERFHNSRCGSGGGHESRLLRAKDVKKPVHVTRFEGTKQTSDKVVLSMDDYDADGPPLLVRPTDRGIEINGVTYDRKGKVVESRPTTAKASALEPMAPDEQVLATAFDAAKGEGATVYWSGDKARWRTFDGQGKPIGPSRALAGDPSRGASLYEDHPILSFTTGGWWLSGLSDFNLLSLDRDALVPGAPKKAEHLFPDSVPPLQLEIERGAMARRSFDPQTGTFAAQAEPLEVASDNYDLLPSIYGAGAASSVLALQGRGEGPPRSLLRFLPATGRWAAIRGALPDEIGALALVTVHQVWGDLVVRAAGSRGVAFTWLKAGESRVYPNKDRRGVHLLSKEQGRGNLYSPLVDEGARMLPPRPGPLIETPELEGIGARCEHILPTAPGTLTMVCAEAVHKDKPGVRVGIQTFHFREQTAP